MRPDEILAYIAENPLDAELTCGIHGPLGSLRTLPAHFLEAMRDPPTEEYGDNCGFIARHLESQLDAHESLSAAETATLVLDLDLLEDLQYLLQITQTRPELELAVTLYMMDDSGEPNYYALYSPAGSDTFSPTRSDQFDLARPDATQHDPLLIDVREPDAQGSLHTSTWGFPASVLAWFPVEDITE